MSTPEERAAVREAIEDACLVHLGRGIGTIHADDIAQAAIDAYVALTRHNYSGYNCRQRYRLHVGAVYAGDPHCPVCPPADPCGALSSAAPVPGLPTDKDQQ